MSGPDIAGRRRLDEQGAERIVVPLFPTIFRGRQHKISMIEALRHGEYDHADENPGAQLVTRRDLKRTPVCVWLSTPVKVIGRAEKERCAGPERPY